ncbi:hypothetical protein EDD98_1307 [Streptomyces sp. PanSC19]|uniref:hypothetical protein n=1 Tax=Streptomyces sp. PanSC19 TaxID=1520455 RepID=UPI000FC1A342|nr:hypothetical protein [Streptomyces sp. PanSC19]ROQ32326.1 hypothetical protein EDD98_1307 [Streptomyces sp. PanSC19]
MADDRDFYSRDRPENPRLAEDRPRGGGPEEPRRRGNKVIWAVVLGIVAVVVIVTILLG